MQQERWNTYPLAMLVAFLVLGVTIWIPGLLLWTSGELWPVSWIAADQQKHHALWSAGLVQNEIAYKRSIYGSRSPEIVVLGSSRVLNMRQRMFSRPFVNMGRGLDLLQSDDPFNSLMENGVPKLVLWGLDYWALAAEREQESSNYKQGRGRITSLIVNGKTVPDIFPRQILSTWSLVGDADAWLLAAKTIMGGSEFPGSRLGLRAVLTDAGGYAPDGSSYDFDVYRRPESAYRRLRENLGDQHDVYQVRPGERVSMRLAQNLRTEIRNLQNRGSLVILYLPALPKQTIDMIQRMPELSRYFDALKATLAKFAADTGIEYYDYLDGSSAGISEREFVDKIHPGEVADARLLLNMASRGSKIARFLNMDTLAQIVRDNGNSPVAAQPFYGRFGVIRLEP